MTIIELLLNIIVLEMGLAMVLGLVYLRYSLGNYPSMTRIELNKEILSGYIVFLLGTLSYYLFFWTLKSVAGISPLDWLVRNL